MNEKLKKIGRLKIVVVDSLEIFYIKLDINGIRV